MPNNSYDDLFDSWGQALNVDPQLAKSVFHAESGGDIDAPDSDGAVGPMQMKPATAAAMATKLGFDPKAVDLHDMRWAVPLAMQYLADGQNATQSAEGALGYYSTGKTDPTAWNRRYIDKVTGLYPQSALIPKSDNPGAGVVSSADSLIGNDSASIGSFLRANGQSLDPTRANWCAAFVNGVLNANGVEGTTGKLKNVATSFLKWGTPVDGAPQAGDVLVQPRGHPVGGIGGHVGIATGDVADGPNGQSFYLMESGNLGGRVAYSWEPAQSVVARRRGQPPPAQVAGQ